jgi:hypothetical protein
MKIIIKELKRNLRGEKLSPGKMQAPRSFRRMVPYIFLDRNAIEIDDPNSKKKKSETFTSLIPTNLIIKKKDGIVEMFLTRVVSEDNKFHDKNDKFNGYVITQDLNGNRIGFSSFKNGKEILSSSKESKKLRPNDMTITVCYTYYNQNCTEGYGCGPVLSVTECETTYVTGLDGTASFSYFMVNFTGLSGPNSPISSFEGFDDLDGFWDWLGSRTAEEVAWYLARPTLIPNAISSYLLSNQAVNWFYCNGDGTGNGNAYKHAMWSAINAMLNSSSIAFQMANAHEDGLDPNSNDVLMDQANNSLGITTYNNNKTYLNSLSDQEATAQLMQLILLQIINGYGTQLNSSYALVPTTSTGRCH